MLAQRIQGFGNVNPPPLEARLTWEIVLECLLWHALSHTCNIAHASFSLSLSLARANQWLRERREVWVIHTPSHTPHTTLTRSLTHSPSHTPPYFAVGPASLKGFCGGVVAAGLPLTFCRIFCVLRFSYIAFCADLASLGGSVALWRRFCCVL